MKMRIDDLPWGNEDAAATPAAIARTFVDGLRVMAILALGLVVLVRAGFQRRA